MTKKPGNINLPKEMIKDLEGFEDVFEEYVETEEYKDLERSKDQENTRSKEHYELQRFLDQENARLTSLEIFLTKKVFLKTNFSQTEKLIQQQLERKTIIKQKIFDATKELDSSLQKNLAIFFNSHFS